MIFEGQYERIVSRFECGLLDGFDDILNKDKHFNRTLSFLFINFCSQTAIVSIAVHDSIIEPRQGKN